MANAGTVSVDFVAATSQFTAEVRKVQTSLKGVEGSLKSLDRVSSTALRFLSAGLLVNFAKQAFNAADAIGDAAERAGIAVESFSRLKFAAEQSDVEIDALTTGLRKFQIAVSNAAEGGNAAAGSLAQIGLSGQQLKSLRLEDQLSEVAQAFTRIQSPADRVRVATELFGRSGEQLIPLLREGAAGINKLTAEADRLGITMSGSTALGIDEADKALKRLKATAAGAASGAIAEFALLISPPKERAAQLALQISRLEGFIRDSEGVLRGDRGLRIFADEEAELSRLASLKAELAGVRRELEGITAATRSGWNDLLPLPWLDKLQEIDISKIQALRLPEFDPESDPDVLRARAQQEFGAATLELAEDTRIRIRENEVGITADLQQQLQIRAEAATAHRNAMFDVETSILAARQQAVASLLSGIQSFAGESKKTAIAMVIVNKAWAIATAVQDGFVAANKALASLPYPANLAAAAQIKAMTALNVAGIAATGFGQIRQIQASGGAPRGSAVNPIITQPSTDSTGATAQRTVQIVINGNIFSTRETADWFIREIRDRIDDEDVVIISPHSRQAAELVPT